MRLHFFHLGLDESVLGRARAQLLDRVTPDRDASFRWGYLLGDEGAPGAEMPAVAQLVRALDDVVVEAMEADTGRRYERSVIKAAVGPPPPAHEGVQLTGFRLDTQPAITVDPELELARVLLNLGPAPHRIRYAAIDRFQLTERGMSLPRSDYQVVDLPPDVGIELIEIPPLEEGRLHALAFWASVVPHVGIDGEEGHFLASYEAVRPFSPRPAGGRVAASPAWSSESA
jgi:hypothetical protein